MSIWEMEDRVLVHPVEFLPSYLTKARARRVSQVCPSLAQRSMSRDLAKAFVKSKEGEITFVRCIHNPRTTGTGALEA